MIVGVDLGSAQIGISVRSKNLVLREPSAVALDTRNRKVLAIGEPAERMRGRTTGTVEVRRPVEEGVAASPQLVQVLVKAMLRRALGWRRFLRPTLRVSVPVTLTAIEKEALQEALSGLGSGKAQFIPAPMAAARGAGTDVSGNAGCMVVDIGATQTQAAILYMNDMIAFDSIPIGGESMDRSIVRYMWENLGLSLSDAQAESLKIEIGTAVESPMEATATGRDVNTRLPASKQIGSETIRLALESPLRQIAGLVRRVLVQTPPELATDLLNNGIMLTGGGALLRGMATYLQDQSQIPVQMAPHPETCAVLGSGA